MSKKTRKQPRRWLVPLCLVVCIASVVVTIGGAGPAGLVVFAVALVALIFAAAYR